MRSALRPVTVAALAMSGLLAAGEAGAEYPGYAQDSQEDAYKNPYGECWRVPDSPAEGPVPGCEGFSDSDGDGVPDDRDKCPNTPKGVAVDADGCPVDGDSDGDGVPNDRDRCPDTVKNCPVDEHGCAIDSDGDGVPDCIDKCLDSPRGVKVDKRGCEIVEDLVLTGIGGPNFAFDSAALTDKAKSWLDERIGNYKRAVQKDRIAEIRVIGHTDSRGDEQYNLVLSERRANAVARHLVDNGIPARLIVVEGKGESQPVASNNTEEGRARNRRVEIDVTTVGEIERARGR